eukprot:gb/GFBE01026797.1/.p1 GENE.gb/GFBE01026797.1/~~gb/GFBE01026797.1/.p1  ORF type:complete len:280 (+),score=60.20 gb/GFBE01026797.1/:1-840(+)
MLSIAAFCLLLGEGAAVVPSLRGQPGLAAGRTVLDNAHSWVEESNAVDMTQVLDLSGPGEKRNLFVVGPESSGTKVLSRILGTDLGLDLLGKNSDSNDFSVVVHMSIPQGGVCNANATTLPRDLPTADGNHSVLKGERVNINVTRLVHEFKKRNETFEVAMIIRDPMVTLASKMESHCKDHATALKEQQHAFELVEEAVTAHSKHVHLICYEELMSNKTALDSLRSEIDTAASDGYYEELHNENSKYGLFEAYECDAMLKTYIRLCPRTALAERYPFCH